MVEVVPWLLEREYRQHRGLDPEGLPETFDEWHEIAQRLTSLLLRTTGKRVVKMVIHAGELETWARMTGCQIDRHSRIAYARKLWNEGGGRRSYRRAARSLLPGAPLRIIPLTVGFLPNLLPPGLLLSVPV